MEYKSSCGGGPIDASQTAGCSVRKSGDGSGSEDGRQVIIAGNHGDIDSLLKEMNIDPSSIGKQITMTMGSSDFAPFLNAGVPGFMWDQSGDVPYTEYIHSQKDTYDTVIPEYMKHSTTVIALAAYGIANLDHLLSRENLLAPLKAEISSLEEVESN